MATAPLIDLVAARRSGVVAGITSVCSAHPEVIGAALALGQVQGLPVLIEATCNQVNHEGGYTGMTPEDFRHFVERIAAEEGFDRAGLILGGDHLGPNPWTDLPAELAMAKATDMVIAYVKAGFKKLHLDTSMSCSDDPVPLPDDVIAARSARLAAAAELEVSGEPPVYVIGTEVPIPGGALEEVADLAVTTPVAAHETHAIHQQAFAKLGISQAFTRVVGLVVQPGVEFGNENVVAFEPAAAATLTKALDDLPLVFEAHSTDYQTPAALADLVRGGFAILKVGPGLTFALRETLYGLDHIADHLFPDRKATLRDVMETLMLHKPIYWQKYYPGGPGHQRLQRHFSYSDRIRYYWTDSTATRAVSDMLGLFGDTPIPAPLISQYLGASYADVNSKLTSPTARSLIRAAITRVLVSYGAACRPANT
jgi:D-tagatose-1,6-bisphosphate aldolase subunit GatZ/KbaZ